jgi:lanosterol synthase
MAVQKREKRRNGQINDGVHDTVNLPQTDLGRWRLKNDRGRQTWHYLHTDEEVQQWPQTTADKYHLGLDTVRGPDSVLRHQC